MKTVRFSKVVEKCGKPEVFILMSETDPDFRSALDAGKIMSLSGESHGAGTEYGMIGYMKNGHGQLLVFPRSLKPFDGTKIVGIKYDLLAESTEEKKESSARSHPPKAKKSKEKPKEEPHQAKPSSKAKKKTDPKPAKKIIPFPAKKAEVPSKKDQGIQKNIRAAMRALEKGNSVAAYNLLKQIVSD